MMLSAVFSLLLCAQQLPDKASLIYPGVPRSSSSAAVAMITHSADVKLDKTSFQLESTSFLKNTSTDPATVTITLPVDGHNPDWNMTDHTTVTAWVDGKPVDLTSTTTMVPETDPQKRASGIRAENYAKQYTFSLGFIGRQAHALKVSCTGPLGHAGLDGAQRVVAYDETGASSWHGPVGQLNYALHYTPRIVFQVFTKLPPEGWEVSSMGAFVKQKDLAPTPGSKLIFTYYPGGYDKIGG